jgi:hypothetical protein
MSCQGGEGQGGVITVGSPSNDERKGDLAFTAVAGGAFGAGAATGGLVFSSSYHDDDGASAFFDDAEATFLSLSSDWFQPSSSDSLPWSASMAERNGDFALTAFFVEEAATGGAFLSGWLYRCGS